MRKILSISHLILMPPLPKSPIQILQNNRANQNTLNFKNSLLRQGIFLCMAIIKKANNNLVLNVEFWVQLSLMIISIFKHRHWVSSPGPTGCRLRLANKSCLSTDHVSMSSFGWVIKPFVGGRGLQPTSFLCFISFARSKEMKWGREGQSPYF